MRLKQIEQYFYLHGCCWVQQNKSNNKRISIAWNMQVKGQVGEHHEFQSANL